MSQRQSPEAAVVSDRDWHLLAMGRLAQIHAEPALYRAAGTKRCLIRVRIGNTTSTPLGVDLADYWNIVYPNQWTVSPQPRRLVVNESQMARRPFTRAERRRLREEYRSGALVQVAAHGSEEYFRDFNGRCPTDADLRRGRYLIMSMSGRLLTTNGMEEEEATLLDLAVAPERRDVVIPLALVWKEVPPDARVIGHP